MKRAALVFIITAVLIILFSSSLHIRSAIAEDAGYSITFVAHKVEILYNGYILVNDTIEITGQVPNTFLIGFPYKYGSHVLKCVAYDAINTFPVSLNVPLENHVGFYGVEVSFLGGTSQVFTVVFVLSNSLLTFSDTSYALDFPAYPSLVKDVSRCNVTIILPGDAVNATVTKEDGVVNEAVFAKENLPAFTYSPASLTFSLITSKILTFDVKELKREIRISERNEIEGSDSYYITSKSPKEMNSIEILLPVNASDQSAQDQFGRRMTKPSLIDVNASRFLVFFGLPLESYRSTRFTVSYLLPSDYIKQEGTNSFNITFPLFQPLNYYIEEASVTFVFPEGARILSSTNTLTDGIQTITKSVFQETVTTNRQGITYLENAFPSENVLQIVYEYNPLWLSFRSTIWIFTLTVVGCAVAFVWRRPKAAVQVPVTAVAVRLRPESIKSFVDAYTEKRKTVLEIESLESKVRKGKIPRRRYKVQRKTMETRLSTLSRNVAESKERMRAAVGQYGDLMRQLEVAETEIKEVETNIKSIEARYNRGDLSLEAYRKLLADYQRRKDKAETTINAVLLRLREEIR